MENHELERYKVKVVSDVNVSRALRVRRVVGIALLLVGGSACGSTEGRPTGVGPDGGGATSKVGHAGAESGLPEGGAAPSDVPTTGGEAPAPTPTEGPCTTDLECDDGKFCNGIERCLPTQPGADVKVCMLPELGPCAEDACDEEANRCDCSTPDHDGDHYVMAGCVTGTQKPDCDDNDGERNPGAKEVCGMSDPTHDEDCNDLTAGTDVDEDVDSYVDAKCVNFGTYQVRGTAAEARFKASFGRDCNDKVKAIHVDAPEICDGLDNNCDDVIDDVLGTPLEDRKRYYRDLDGDYWGDAKNSIESVCNSAPYGYVTNVGDCDDANSQISPSRAEICDGIDNDCDELGLVDQLPAPGSLMLDEPYDGGLTTFECNGDEGWEIEKCPRDRLDCDEEYLNGCETIGTTLCNCHACGNACQFSCGEEGCKEIRAVSAGRRHTCLLVQASPDDGKGRIACMGANTEGQLGQGMPPENTIANFVPELFGVTSMVAGDRHSCAVKADGRAYCWGANDYGQLGVGSPGGETAVPQPILKFPDDRVEQVEAGADHSCAIFDEVGGGTRTVQCWGRGDDGQLGNGYAEDSGYADRVVRSFEGAYYPLLGPSQVAAGDAHSCALTQGKVECWGSNAAGQLGHPLSLAGSSTALLVPGLDGVVVEQIAAAAVNTCARASKKVYCWGANADFQLANDDVANGDATLIPLPEDIVSIAMGPLFACALSLDGAVRCWGSNQHGERGVTVPTPSIQPSLVPLSGSKSIFGGNGNHVCVLKMDGSAWCWGKNDAGQMGNGFSSAAPQPLATRILPSGGAPACAGYAVTR